MDATYRIHRKDPVPMDELIREYIRAMKLEAGLDRQLIYSLWNEVSGAGDYTIGLNFSAGVLYVTFSSSVVRSQIYFQRDVILRRLNEELLRDSLFSGASENVVKSLVLK